jgi:hypothetical protein
VPGLAETAHGFDPAEGFFDVLIATEKTIRLGIRSQVYKLQRNMGSGRRTASASLLFRNRDLMELSDETAGASPAPGAGRSPGNGTGAESAENSTEAVGRGSTWK